MFYDEKNIFFIIYGVSGSGKSTLLNFIKKFKNVSIHQKDTNRPKRLEEKFNVSSELRFLKNFDKKQYVCLYKQYGYFYGVRKDLILKSIKNKDFHFIIINNINSIKKFKSRYRNCINIYLHCDPNKVIKNFRKRSKKEFEQRKKIINVQYLNYIKNNTLFDHKIINFGNIINAQKQLVSIFKLYLKK